MYNGGSSLSSGSRLLSSGSLGDGDRLDSGGLNSLDFLNSSSNGGLGSRHYCKKCKCELRTRIRTDIGKGYRDDEREKNINEKREKGVLRNAGPLAREK